MKLSIIFSALIIVAVLISCTKSDNSDFTDSPIIESYLKPGDYPIIKIRRQTPFSSEVSYSDDEINTLSIQITNNSITKHLTPLGEGLYIDSTIIVKEGEMYDISFVYNSKTVSAYTNIPSKPIGFEQSATTIIIEQIDFSGGLPTTRPTMADPVSLTWENGDDSYYIVLIENMETSLTAINDFGDEEPPGNRFKKPPTNSSGIEIRSMEFQYYGLHRLILYHVLPDYASLYSDNETSSQNLTNPSTSIVNGYGIFTGLNSDTLFINVLSN
jgi:hypothetical protein